MHYQKHGETGQVIVIIHGLFGSSDNWRGIAKSLSTDYQVYSIDLPNHGRSQHSDEMGYQDMAALFGQLWQELQLDDIVLIGHSIGGKLAMVLAEQYQDLIAKLIVVDIAPKAYPNRHQEIFNALLSLDLKLLTNRREADQALSRTITDKAIRQFLLMNLIVDNGELSWRINLPAIIENYPELMAEAKQQSSDIPTLFIKGGKSDYIEPGDMRLIQSYFPNNQLKTIAEVGHWVHAESPSLFLTAVNEFLQND